MTVANNRKITEAVNFVLTAGINHYNFHPVREYTTIMPHFNPVPVSNKNSSLMISYSIWTAHYYEQKRK